MCDYNNSNIVFRYKVQYRKAYNNPPSLIFYPTFLIAIPTLNIRFTTVLIALQDYQNTDWSNLIQLWKFYNLHIIQVIQSIDKNKLNSYWCDFEGTKVTLKEMIEGYLDHLLLHIKEIHELANLVPSKEQD